MKYTITLYSKWNKPYFYANTDKYCISTDYQSYETTDVDLCKQIVKDFLDVPETELTLEEIRKQFEDQTYCILSEEKLVSIQNYYNGRLGLYNIMMQDIDNTDEVKTLHYDIPYKYNHFIVEDDVNEEQLEAYIEVKVEKD